MTDIGVHEGSHLGDLVLEARIDVTAPLPDLTAALGEACQWADTRPKPPVLALRLGSLTSPAQRSWPAGAAQHDVNRWERAVRRLERTEAVIIAIAAGLSGGPAIDLLLAADYRIASGDLRLLLPVNDGHMWPGMAIHRLVQQVGIARARQFVLWGHELSAQRAYDLGLVDELTDDLDPTLAAAALLLGRISGPDFAIRRQLLHEAATSDYDEALGAHLAACDRELRRLAASEDGSDL